MSFRGTCPEQGRRIEYKGQILPDLAKRIGDCLFGCDECVLACPYQQNAPVCKNEQFKFYPDMARLNLQEVLNLDRKKLLEHFSHQINEPRTMNFKTNRLKTQVLFLEVLIFANFLLFPVTFPEFLAIFANFYQFF